MALPLLIGATVVIDALAIAFLIRGLRATSRAAITRCVGHCAALAFGEVLVVGVGRAAALVGSFAGGATEPAMKAAQLSQSFDAGNTISSVGGPATALPVVFAILLFVRGRRFPASRRRHAR